MNPADPPDSEEELPEWVERELALAPYNSDKRGLAELITRLFAPTSYRTVEERPLTWRRHNGKATTPTRPAIVSEYRRWKASPEYRVVRTPKKTPAGAGQK
jgi:hypothetical protein